jgi:RNA polymerase sigma-70 factor (sigma-E family)
VRGAYPSLVRFAFLLTGESGAAEDAVQSALARCFVAQGRPDPPNELQAYVRRSVVNAVISEKRRSWARLLRSTPVPEGVEATDEHGRVDDRDALRRLLQDLPPRQRVAVVLRYYAGLSEAETAETMHCSVGNVKALASRGLGALRAANTAGGAPLAYTRMTGERS